MTSDFLTNAANILSTIRYLVALTGAGISKESNIPTFRGKDGLWRQYNALDLATPSAFARNPSLVWEWYAWRQDLIAKCEPNPAHRILAKWEQTGLLKSLITQNVDDLHRRAGSKKLLEVHGNIWAIKCTQCSYHSRLDAATNGIPTCPSCEVNLRPDVVWFGESLDSTVMTQVLTELERADAIIVIGTSAVIQPSASFPMLVKRNGGKIIEVNTEKTPLTPAVDVHLSGKAGVILPQLDSLLA